MKDYNCEFCGAVYQQDERNGYAGEQFITSGIYLKTCAVCTAKLKALVAYVEANAQFQIASNNFHNARQQKPQIPVWQQAAE